MGTCYHSHKCACMCLGSTEIEIHAMPASGNLCHWKRLQSFSQAHPGDLDHLYLLADDGELFQLLDRPRSSFGR